MSLLIHRRDTELRFVTKFGENRPLRSCRKVAWFTKQKSSGSAGLIPAPIFAKFDRCKIKERIFRCCSPDVGIPNRSSSPEVYINLCTPGRCPLWAAAPVAFVFENGPIAPKIP